MESFNTNNLHARESLNSDKLYKEYILYCKARNLSIATIRYYEACWKPFMSFLESEEIALEDINATIINGYMVHLKEDNKKNSISINTRIRGIRTILYYFMNQGYINNFHIILPKTDKCIKEVYSDAELEKLLKKPNVNCDFTEYRNWVITNFLLATGVRSRTLVNIRNKDIDLNNQLVKLTTTKSKKQQIIPLSNSLCKISEDYLRYRKGDDDDYTFCSWCGEQLLTTGLNQAIRQYNRKRGVLKTSIHLYRHTFAKKWILNGGDIFTLQKLLGHSSLEMVRNYVNIYQSDMYHNFNQFNPLETTKPYKGKIIK